MLSVEGGCLAEEAWKMPRKTVLSPGPESRPNAARKIAFMEDQLCFLNMTNNIKSV